MTYIRIILVALAAGALSACGSDWTVQNARFFAYSNQDVRVAAKIIMNKKAKPISGGDGVQLKMRLYTAGYGTVLTEMDQNVGADLESGNQTGTPEIYTVAISSYRLGGTPSNSYADFCADFQLENSNTHDWVQLGCVHYTDQASNDPTGGVENM